MARAGWAGSGVAAANRRELSYARRTHKNAAAGTRNPLDEGVTVVINTYKRPDALQRAVELVAGHTRLADLAALIKDYANGSVTYDGETEHGVKPEYVQAAGAHGAVKEDGGHAADDDLKLRAELPQPETLRFDALMALYALSGPQPVERDAVVERTFAYRTAKTRGDDDIKVFRQDLVTSLGRGLLA